MKVLVTAASRHGSTAEIAAAIGATLRASRLETDVLPPEQVGTIEDYDAVVLGSAVYMGHWLEPARRFVEEHRASLAARPVWLFSSGPLGDPPSRRGDPPEVEAIRQQTGARGHRVLAGRLDKDTLGFAEKLVVAGVRAPEGDFRPWTEIEDWAGTIADALAA